jgi:hypothetical protein
MNKSLAYNIGRFFLALAWGGAIIGAGIGIFILVTGLATAQSAPQEAVVAALACACAIIPYCIARAFTEVFNLMKDNG